MKSKDTKGRRFNNSGDFCENKYDSDDNQLNKQIFLHLKEHYSSLYMTCQDLKN